VSINRCDRKIYSILETTKPTPHSPLACLDPSPELVPQVKARSETVNAIERWIKMSQCPLRTQQWQLTNSNCQVKQQPTLGCLLALGVRTAPTSLVLLLASDASIALIFSFLERGKFPRHPLGLLAAGCPTKTFSTSLGGHSAPPFDFCTHEVTPDLEGVGVYAAGAQRSC